MRRIAIAVAILALLGTATACGSSGGNGSSAASSATSAAAAPAAPRSADPSAADCSAGPWPKPLPDLRGKSLGDQVVGVALCFDITSITDPDGNNVIENPAAQSLRWTVTDQSPAAGTPVQQDTPVTLKVQRAS